MTGGGGPRRSREGARDAVGPCEKELRLGWDEDVSARMRGTSGTTAMPRARPWPPPPQFAKERPPSSPQDSSMTVTRPSGRAFDEMRRVTLERGVMRHAEGSCLVKFGDTHVLCAASVETSVPPWLRNSGKGWVTAEYAMLPRATHDRMRREVTKGAPSGRTQEIQRLIGRSLRAVDRPQGARREADLDRLRRAAGRRRHAHRVDHRRLGRAQRRGAVDDRPEHARRLADPRPRRGHLLRRLPGRAGHGPRLPGGFGGRDGRQLRPDRPRRPRRGAGDGGRPSR